MFVHACDSVSARVSVFQCVSFSVFQCVSVSLCFVWLSMSSNVLLCCWFLCEYVYILCFCLIKWQSASSCWTHTINSMHVGPHGNRWMCVRLPIHPNLHTYRLRVCVCVCMRAVDSVSVRVLCFSVCQFHTALFDEVWVVLYYYAIDFWVSIYAFHVFV